MKKIPWFIFFLIIAISCLDEPDCYQLDNQDVVLDFSVLSFGADNDTLVDIRTSGTDSIFYPNTIVSSVASSIALPLNPNTKELTYIFTWKNGSIDTLLIGYSAQIQFVSEECNQRYVFGNLFLPTKSTFDSVRVVNSTPSLPASLNLIAYRCAKADLVGIKFKTNKGTTQLDSALAVSSLTADFPTQINLSGSISSFFLPLNKLAGATTFEFTLDDGAKESLQLSYTPITRASPVKDCDSVTFFSRIRIASTSFDTTSTKIIKTSSSGTTSTGTSTQDPAIINLEIFL